MSEKKIFGDRRIWTNGCYDILHVAHVRLFDFAKSLGDLLVVGIDSDERVKKLKGKSRPINNAADRREMLLSNRNIDRVVVFNSDEELRAAIRNYDIQTIVVGDDYKHKVVIGSEYCNEVVFFQKIEDYSTTRILSDWEQQRLDRNDGR